ncbi:MAG: efflux RND transporter permease subunit [Arhodomonas sp.]|nr:efflux RND transporter permease subunit [Arhodomonas sp.]
MRLRDIARSELDAESYDSEAWYKGQPAVFMAVEQSPGANPLDTAQAVERKVDQIRAQLPEGMDVVLPYDASEFIEDSINEVFKTIAEAVLHRAAGHLPIARARSAPRWCRPWRCPCR